MSASSPPISEYSLSATAHQSRITAPTPPVGLSLSATTDGDGVRCVVVADGGQTDNGDGAVDPVGSLEFYRAIAEPAASVIVVVGADFVIKWISPSVSYIGGFEPDELVGSSAIDLVHPDDVRFAIDGLAEAANRESVDLPVLGRPYPFRLLAKHGPIWCEIGGDIRFDDPMVQGMILRIRQAPTHELLDRFLDRSVSKAPLNLTLAPLLGSLEFEAPGSSATIGHRWDGRRFHEVATADEGSPASAVSTRRLVEQMTSEELAADPTVRRSLPWVVAMEQDELISRDAAETPPALRDAMQAADAGACWCYPVTATAAAASSCLVLWRSVAGPPWLGHDVYVERTARLAALAVERHEYEEHLLDAASRDPLTGLPNRRAFFEMLEHCDADQPLALLFLDLDGFKPVNDALGHEAGDTVLRVIAQRLQHSVRDLDTIARLGGDEFAILLAPDFDRVDAEAIADRILETVTAPIVTGAEQVHVGVSIGIAMVDAPGTNGGPATLLDAADAAMYRAKKAGGSRWLTATTTTRAQTR